MTVAHLAAAGWLGAAERVAGAGERILRMTDFFETTLPGTLGWRNVALFLSPKFADLRDREFLRLPLEARYGISERIDLTAGVCPFGPNPLRAGNDHRWGLGEVRLGARRDLGALGRFGDESTVGVETRLPLGRPPIPLNDQYGHVRVFLAVARDLPGRPGARLYTNIAHDHSVALSLRDAPPREIVRRQVTEVVPGWLYKPREWGAFAEYRLRFVNELSDDYPTHEARLGGLWEIPPARTGRWGLPGIWQLEVAYRQVVCRGSDRDRESGVSTRVTWRTRIRGGGTGPGMRPAEARR